MVNENSPWLALKMSINLGYELTSEHPEIADYYREGMSHPQIVKAIQSNGGFGREISSKSVLEHAVKYSLAGNYRQEAGKVFDGLMSRMEYENISATNRANGRKMGPIVSKKENKGIFNLTEKQKDTARRKSSKTRGQVLWETYERSDAFSLRRQGFNYGSIAEILNRAHHKGKEIRNRNSIGCMFKRQKKS